MISRIGIIGVGLIGGSVALGLRKAGMVGETIGYDLDSRNLAEALHLGIIDSAAASLEAAAEGADLVLIAVPVGASMSVFRGLLPGWCDETIYTDVGSTKLSVIEALKSVFGSLPSNFVPGHPIAGAETSGAAAALSDLFQERRVILTPLPEASLKAVEVVRGLWQALGAKVSLMSAEHHDEVLAATSHLPHVLAFVLTELLGRCDNDRELFSYAAGGLRDFTRIASSDPRMWRDICLSNRDQLLPLMERYRDALGAAAALMRSGDAEGLTRLFSDAGSYRQRFMDQMEK